MPLTPGKTEKFADGLPEFLLALIVAAAVPFGKVTFIPWPGKPDEKGVPGLLANVAEEPA